MLQLDLSIILVLNENGFKWYSRTELNHDNPTVIQAKFLAILISSGLNLSGYDS